MDSEQLNALLDELQATAKARDEHEARVKALAEALEWLALGAMTMAEMLDEGGLLSALAMDVTKKPTPAEARALTSMFTARHGLLLAYAQLRPLARDSGVRRASGTFGGGIDLDAPTLAEHSWADMGRLASYLAEHGTGPWAHER